MIESSQKPARRQTILNQIPGPAVTLGWEKSGDISALEACQGTLRGPSSPGLAAVQMLDDRARMEIAKKEKVALCHSQFSRRVSSMFLHSVACLT